MFEDAIARLSDDELQKLERPNLGDLSFGEALPNLRRIGDLLIGLNQQDPTDVFPNLQAEASQHVTQVIQYVDQVQAFTVDVSNPADQRRSLLNGILGEKNWFLQQVRQSSSGVGKRSSSRSRPVRKSNSTIPWPLVP